MGEKKLLNIVLRTLVQILVTAEIIVLIIMTADAPGWPRLTLIERPLDLLALFQSAWAAVNE